MKQIYGHQSLRNTMTGNAWDLVREDLEAENPTVLNNELPFPTSATGQPFQLPEAAWSAMAKRRKCAGSNAYPSKKNVPRTESPSCSMASGFSTRFPTSDSSAATTASRPVSVYPSWERSAYDIGRLSVVDDLVAQWTTLKQTNPLHE